VSKPFSLLGTRTTPICEVALTDVKIPFHHRLCPEGQGMDISCLSWQRSEYDAALGIGLVGLRYTTASSMPMRGQPLARPFQLSAHPGEGG